MALNSNVIQSEHINLESARTVSHFCTYGSAAGASTDTYDLGLRSQATGALYHVGSTAGNTFLPATGYSCLAIQGGSVTLPAGTYWVEVTTTCSSSCPTLGPAWDTYEWWPRWGSWAGAGSTTGGTLPASYTEPGPSYNLQYIGRFFFAMY
jgi:hypothetical protein